jgi:hypothetical protein
MNWNQLIANPAALISLLCIVGFVLAINLPLLFPTAIGKMFEREAKTWSKALQGGTEASNRNKKQMDDLHQQIQELQKTDPDRKD